MPTDPDKAHDIREMLLCNKGAFSLYKFDIGNVDPTKYGYFEIDTGDEEPHWEQQRRRSNTEREALHQRVYEYKMADVTEAASGEWACNPLLIPKKDGDYRLCIDLRGLNSKTRKSRYPLPRTEELVSAVRACEYMTTLDLKSAYNAIQIKPEDREKTAFYAGDYGLQCFKRLAMGLSNAPAFFQQFIEQLLRDMATKGDLIKGETRPFVKVFLDDLIIYSRTWKEHVHHIHLVLQRLEEAGLKISPSKCWYGQPEVLYLGFYISGTSTRPDPKAVSCIDDYPRPTTVKQVQSFLGACNFFRAYIKDFAKRAAPLYALSKVKSNKRRPTDISERWGEAQEQSFTALKKALASSPVLVQPDFTKPFYLHTDASGEAIGAVLTQDDDTGNPRAVGYASRVLSDVERRYSATEGECLAVMFGVESFRWALHGNQFHLYSDHQALQFLMGGGAARSNNRKHHRWLAELQSYNFTIEHRAGVDNLVPDALSRCYPAPLGEREGLLVSALQATLQGMSFSIHHRPNTRLGFKLDYDEDGLPLATRETIAACLLSGHTADIDINQATLAKVAASHATQVVTATDGPEEISDLLSSYLATTPAHQIEGNAMALVPDPSLLRHTSHEEWIQWLPHFTIKGVLHSQAPNGIPHLLISRARVEGFSPVARVGSGGLSVPPMMPLVDQQIVVPRVTRELHVMEVCGGLGVFLEALLRNGYSISKYTYMDSCSTARRAALHRVWRLHDRYPRQFPKWAFKHCMDFPQNVHHVQHHHLATLPEVDFFAAGPPCQPFSAAGSQEGWTSSNSRVFPATLRILVELQRRQPRHPLSYVIENVPAAASFPDISLSLGKPARGNAIDHGSAAYRDTLFWSNIAPHDVIQARLSRQSVKSRWTMRQFLLDMGLHRRFLMHEGNTEFFGKFVRTVGSYAHRLTDDGLPGPSQLLFRGNPIELPPSLREAAMGFVLGDTCPPGISEEEHHQLLGNCIDVNLATQLVAAATTPPPRVCCGSCVVSDQCQFEGMCDCFRCSHLHHAQPTHNVTVGVTAAERQRIKAVADESCQICRDTYARRGQHGDLQWM